MIRTLLGQAPEYRVKLSKNGIIGSVLIFRYEEKRGKLHGGGGWLMEVYYCATSSQLNNILLLVLKYCAKKQQIVSTLKNNETI